MYFCIYFLFMDGNMQGVVIILWKYYGNWYKFCLYELFGLSIDFVDNYNMGWVLSQEVCKSIVIFENQFVMFL